MLHRFSGGAVTGLSWFSIYVVDSMQLDIDGEKLGPIIGLFSLVCLQKTPFFNL